MQLIDPEAWERGCQVDEVRNDFVAPTVVSLARTMAAPRVIDVGCGTGYVSRLAARYGGCERAQFTLLDHDDKMAAFAQHASSAMPNLRVVCSQLVEYANGAGRDQFDIVFCSYTALEIEDFDTFSHSMRSLVSVGKIVFFVPDTVEDIIEFYVGDRSTSFVRGLEVHRINKIDHFTGRMQTFIARQVVDYIIPMLDSETKLSRVAHFVTRKNGRHLALVFDRSRGGVLQ